MKGPKTEVTYPKISYAHDFCYLMTCAYLDHICIEEHMHYGTPKKKKQKKKKKQNRITRIEQILFPNLAI